MKHSKKFLSVLLALCVLFAHAAALADGNRFYDVSDSAWYAENVRAVASAGIINGRGNGLYAPDENVTLAETIKLAAVIYDKLNDSRHTFYDSDTWYQPYGDYLSSITGIKYFMNDDPNKIVIREQFADIMSIALANFSDSERNKNTVEDGSIPDLSNTSAHQAVYDLYRAGILTGNDSSGTFYPMSYIKRSEVAAIVHRFIDSSQRKDITLGAPSLSVSAVVTSVDIADFEPDAWSWEAEGEGYGLSAYTSGKYVRLDGKAVLYIESSTTSDGFDYLLYAMPDYNSQNPLIIDKWGDGGAEYMLSGDADDFYNRIFFEDDGNHKITVTSDRIGDHAVPDGVYELVKEKI